MTRLVLQFLLLLSIPLISDEIEIPDDFIPIEGNSEIIFSYEFDDEPRIIERISQTEFLIMMFDDEDAVFYIYNSENNSVEKKSEFLINPDEYLYGYNIKDNKLYLYFTNSGHFSFVYFRTFDGFCWRETAIDLKTFLPLNSEIVYITADEEGFDIEEINEDLDYASSIIDKSLYTNIGKEFELEASDFRKMNITFNNKDSARKNFIHLARDRDNNTLYARVSNFETFQSSPKISFIKLLNSIESIYDVDVNYTYLDDNSNLYFVLSWIDEELDKMFISLNKITSEGKLTQKIKEMPFEIDGEEYRFKRFEPIYENENEIKLFGVSRYEGDEDSGLEPVSGLYTITLNTQTMKFELVSRTLTEEEGKKINTENVEINNSYDTEFKFNIISKIIEYDNGYVLLTENSTLYKSGTTDRVTYSNYLDDINLFSLNRDLSFRWNKYIDRDFRYIWYIPGVPLNSSYWSPKKIILTADIENEFISFNYTTTEPEYDIRSVTYNLKLGELVSEISYFENGGYPSYFPCYQYGIEDKEFVTLLSLDDYFLVRYKLLK